MSEMAVHNGVCYLAGQVAVGGAGDIAAQTREVLGSVDALLGRAGTDKTRILRAQIYLADKNIDRAIETLDNYVKAMPTDTQAVVLLATAQMSKGRSKKKKAE